MRWEVKPLGELGSLFTDGDWIETKDQSQKGFVWYKRETSEWVFLKTEGIKRDGFRRRHLIG